MLRPPDPPHHERAQSREDAAQALFSCKKGEAVQAAPVALGASSRALLRLHADLDDLAWTDPTNVGHRPFVPCYCGSRTSAGQIATDEQTPEAAPRAALPTKLRSWRSADSPATMRRKKPLLANTTTFSMRALARAVGTRRGLTFLNASKCPHAHQVLPPSTKKVRLQRGLLTALQRRLQGR